MNQEYQKSTGSEILEDILEKVPYGAAVTTRLDQLQRSQFSQKKEQEADEFGVLTAHRLGYDPFAFADLLDRLHGLSDAKTLNTIKSFNSSHKTLAQRAQYIRNFLVTKGIKPDGRLASGTYLKNINQLAKSSPRVKVIDPKIDLLAQELKKKKFLSIKEFLQVMEQIQSRARDLHLLTQLDPPAASDFDDVDNEFMMELVRVLRPWWLGLDPNLVRLREILMSLGKMGVGSLPVVGDAIDLYEVLTGQDFYTNEPLSFGERVASTLGILAGSGHQWQTMVKKFEAVEDADKKIGEIAKTAQEIIQSSPLSTHPPKFEVTKKLPEDWIKEEQKKYRLIKDEKSYEKLKDLAETTRQKNFPHDWAVKVTKVTEKEQGLEFIHPDNHHTRIRVMPGDPHSEFPNSREPYVRQTANGQPVDHHGRIVLRRTNEAHIPLKDYQFWEFWKNHGKK